MNLAEEIHTYVRLAINYGNATDKGKPNVANKYYDRILATYKHIAKYGAEGIKKILTLCHHDNLWVRYWAAFHSIHHNEKVAKNALLKISKKDGFVAVDAKYTIIEWENGNLGVGSGPKRS